MGIRDDEDFKRAAEAWASVLNAQDAGESADESAKLARRLAQGLADEYERPYREVMQMISAKGFSMYTDWM